MRKVFILCILVAFLLGTWQVKRFLFKREAQENLINCHITTLDIPRLYCNFVGELPLYKNGDVYLLYMDVNHFNVLVPTLVEGRVLLVNIGYVTKDERENIRERVRQVFASNEELIFDGYLVPAGGLKIPFITNDLTNLELYSVDPKELSANLGLPLSEYILYSTSNYFIADSSEVISPLQRPKLKVIMHLWYALMWYSVGVIGLVYYLFNTNKHKSG